MPLINLIYILIILLFVHYNNAVTYEIFANGSIFPTFFSGFLAPHVQI